MSIHEIGLHPDSVVSFNSTLGGKNVSQIISIRVTDENTILKFSDEGRSVKIDINGRETKDIYRRCFTGGEFEIGDTITHQFVEYEILEIKNVSNKIIDPIHWHREVFATLKVAIK